MIFKILRFNPICLLLALLLLCLIQPLLWAGQVINQVPPKPHGIDISVNDFGNLIDPADEETIRNTLKVLDESGKAQVTVLTLPDTDRELADFAPEIMNEWGVGHESTDDGVLVLVNAYRTKNNLSGNRIFVGTGYGAEGILPDAVVGRVLDEEAIPRFEQGEFSKGILNVTLALAQKIESGEPAFSYNDPWVWLAYLLFFGIFIMPVLLVIGGIIFMQIKYGKATPEEIQSWKNRRKDLNWKSGRSGEGFSGGDSDSSCGSSSCSSGSDFGGGSSGGGGAGR